MVPDAAGNHSCRNCATSPVCCNPLWLVTLLLTRFPDRTFTLTNHNKPIAVFLVSLMIFQCLVVFYAMSRRGKNQGSSYLTA